MNTYSLKTKLTETGKFTLVNFPFQKEDEIEITIIQNDLSKSESTNEVWEAYLQSEKEREEVYQRLADS